MREELNTVVDDASVRIRRERSLRATRLAVPHVVGLVVLIPAIALGVQVVRWLFGLDASPIGWWELVVASVAVPLAIVLFQTWRARGAAVDRRDALAAVDERLSLEDRLQTADEFLDAEDRSGFMQASIEDAQQSLERARRGSWELTSAGAPVARARLAVNLPLAALLVLAFWWLGTIERGPKQDWSLDTSTTQLPDVPTPTTTEDDRPDRDPIASPEQVEPSAPKKRQGADEVAGKSTDAVTDDIKESTGSTGVGRSAEASSAKGSSSSKAAPSNQGQASKENPDKKQPKARKPKDQKPKVAGPPKKKPAEESGATTGRGSSKGSNRNPSSSDWNSRDHAQSPDEKSIENDEDIEDEDEEQESRGGVQPNLRDRKPPVNRDLRIGFGNRKNPDANGRGGPSEQKKSRGVASLVLGVPIPDRIKGQPNPGKTKITQERIEPKGETVPPVPAEARTPRSAPVGDLSPRPVPPWMRELVKKYFLPASEPSNRP